MRRLCIQRGFWQALMHTSVSFRTLTENVKRIDIHVRSAERTYRWVGGRNTVHVH